MPYLNLPSSSFELAWNLIQERIMFSPILDEAGITRVFITGDPNQTRDMPSYQAPVIVFGARLGPRRWQDESLSQVGNLSVAMRVTLTVPDTGDHLRLQSALERTVLSSCDCDWQSRLIEAGANTGLVLFDQPLNVVPSRGDVVSDMMVLAGQFSVEIVERYSC